MARLSGNVANTLPDMSVCAKYCVTLRLRQGSDLITAVCRNFRPMQSDRCSAVFKATGQRCTATTLLGRRTCLRHGGASTGPRTAEGKRKCAAVRTVHDGDTIAFAKYCFTNTSNCLHNQPIKMIGPKRGFSIRSTTRKTHQAKRS